MKVDKGTLNSYFETGDYPTEAQFKSVQDSCLGVLDDVGDLPVPSADFLGNEYKIGNVYYKCVLDSGNYIWQQTGTVVPSNDYPDITNKPKINGHTLGQNNTLAEIGAAPSDIPTLSAKTPVDDTDLCYVHSGGVLYKATVADLKKPHTVQVTIESGDWTLDDGKYVATKAVADISPSTIAVVTPDAGSIEDFISTPFWANSLGNGSVEFMSLSAIAVDVTVNIMYW